jgi:hypothetical protein
MAQSPYRDPSASSPAARPDRDGVRGGDADLVVPYALVWLAALVRVASLLAAHERLDGEAALAAVLVAALPLVGARSLAALVRRAAAAHQEEIKNR